MLPMIPVLIGLAPPSPKGDNDALIIVETYLQGMNTILNGIAGCRRSGFWLIYLQIY